MTSASISFLAGIVVGLVVGGVAGIVALALVSANHKAIYPTER